MMLTCRIKALNSPFLTKTNKGLGNILFQLSTTLALAKDNGMSTSFPDIDKLCDKFNNGKVYKETIFRNIETTNINWIDTIEDNKNGKKNERYLILKVNPKINSILIGYFQSYKYFNHRKDLILETFSCCDKVEKIIQDRYHHILQTPAIGLHIRFYTHIKISDEIVKYYDDALSKVTGSSNSTVIIFSDSVDAAKKLLEPLIIKHGLKSYYIDKDETDLISLYLMTKCKTMIISYSTFSWWGAYLNKDNSKVVYYPTCYAKCIGKTEQHLKDLIPPDWLGL